MQTKEEGPRAFSVLLQHIGEGELHRELSEATQELTGDLTDLVTSSGQDAKGSITLVLNFAARRNGTVDVSSDVKKKTPKLKRPASLFWATKGGNLAVENPRQTKLPLRDVSPPARDPINVDAPAAPARGV